ncbi:zinc finger protein ZAT11 [Amaranthus tricolor]|uniref:zinc finger protein ZAT11 n=1 Tax=Amaranthus tricolor TaxID=29722 RepID=UPI0025829F51|nr:zinc finger protein ZAT11 [Amaranthus tricolor]
MDYSTEEDFSTFTTKRRRTKRHRSLLSASASSTYCGGSDGAVVTAASDPPNKAAAASSTSYTSSSSASPSDHLNDVMSEVTTEEIDMANFLILLSQGLHKNTNNSNTTVLYECKTCNRTFSSFQALGGHRTSHKKIKPPLSPSIIPSTDHHNSDNIDAKIKIVDSKVRDRVHECSICGSEFPSGQALGGHMRRHRAAAPPSSTEIAPDGSTEVMDTGGGGPRNILSLDLNLPAPDDQDGQQDDHMENTFVHVLPRPAPLVDCHN